jgi:hypothetical protein
VIFLLGFVAMCMLLCWLLCRLVLMVLSSVVFARLDKGYVCSTLVDTFQFVFARVTRMFVDYTVS